QRSSALLSRADQDIASRLAANQEAVTTLLTEGERAIALVLARSEQALAERLGSMERSFAAAVAEIARRDGGLVDALVELGDRLPKGDRSRFTGRLLGLKGRGRDDDQPEPAPTRRPAAQDLP